MMKPETMCTAHAAYQMPIKLSVRVQDSKGIGLYGASRKSGDKRRAHKGIDLAFAPNAPVYALSPGVVTNVKGYPYNPSDKQKGHFRYVQIEHDGLAYRYFYTTAQVKVGDAVEAGDLIATAQDIAALYPGMINHVHFEILKQGYPVDPTSLVMHYASDKPLYAIKEGAQIVVRCKTTGRTFATAQKTIESARLAICREGRACADFGIRDIEHIDWQLVV